MRVRVMLQIAAEDDTFGEAHEIACFEKATECAEQLGLSLAEGKVLLTAVQLPVVKAQVGLWAERHRACKVCGARRKSKGNYPVLFQTLYGDIPLESSRPHRCTCQSADTPATNSLLCELLPDHIAPERLYLESRWASLVPYAAAADLLSDVLRSRQGRTLRRSERMPFM